MDGPRSDWLFMSPASVGWAAAEFEDGVEEQQKPLTVVPFKVVQIVK